jgi:hypothetical protein
LVLYFVSNFALSGFKLTSLLFLPCKWWRVQVCQHTRLFIYFLF